MIKYEILWRQKISYFIIFLFHFCSIFSHFFPYEHFPLYRRFLCFFLFPFLNFCCWEKTILRKQNCWNFQKITKNHTQHPKLWWVEYQPTVPNIYSASFVVSDVHENKKWENKKGERASNPASQLRPFVCCFFVRRKSTMYHTATTPLIDYWLSCCMLHIAKIDTANWHWHYRRGGGISGWLLGIGIRENLK